MLSRRTMVKAGITTLVSLASVNHVVSLAQEGTPDASVGEVSNLHHYNLPELPEATAGEIEVVLSGYGDGRSAGVVIHNATDSTVGLDEVSGIARGADGSLFAVSDNSILAPYVIEPGEYATGLVSFDKDLLPNVEITFEVKTETPGSGWIEILDLPVIEADVDGSNVIGIVENNTDQVASSLVAVVGVFFDDGEVAGWFRTYLNDGVDPGGIGTFSTRSIDGYPTDSWAMAASGWAG